MKNESPSAESTYYNQFVDIKEVIPLKMRHKYKNNNLDNIKIATRKLPPDFFRPYTRETEANNNQNLEREMGIKTPCFGDDKKQSYSLSLIPKQKRNLDTEPTRICTLPVHEPQPQPAFNPRNPRTRDQPRNHQLSQRNSTNRQLTRAQQHQSTQRQKIKYKKLTLNDQMYLQERDRERERDRDREKKMLNLEYQNRIRLNIKKFFQEDNEFIVGEKANNKSGRRLGLEVDRIGDSEPFKKLKVKKLPPLL